MPYRQAVDHYIVKSDIYLNCTLLRTIVSFHLPCLCTITLMVLKCSLSAHVFILHAKFDSQALAFLLIFTISFSQIDDSFSKHNVGIETHGKIGLE